MGKTTPFKKSPQPHFNKESNIIIIGAGPSGLHMGLLLKRNGFKNVKIFEKESVVGGKSKTIYRKYDGKEIPFEMGTHVVSFSYKRLHKLIKEYDAGLLEELLDIKIYSPNLQKAKGGDPSIAMPMNDWVFADCEYHTTPHFLWFLPDKLQGIPLVIAARRYKILHEKIFGEYDHVVPPRPDDETMETINKPFSNWLFEHHLQALFPLFVATTCLQGYGYLDSIPAYYGLIWNSPYLIEQMLVRKVVAYVLRNGYSHMWSQVAEKGQLDVLLNAEVKSVRRNLNSEKRDQPIEVEVSIQGQKSEIFQGDFLILACPLNHAFAQNGFMKDGLPEEIDLFSCLKHSSLISSLIKCTKGPELDAQMILRPEILCAATDGGYYAHVNSVRESFPEINVEGKKHRYAVAYQLYQEYANRSEEAKKRLLIDLKEAGFEDVEILHQFVPEYFPHYDQQKVREYYPWKNFEIQGKHKTWYIGGAVSFETVETVLETNYQFLELFLHIHDKN